MILDKYFPPDPRVENEASILVDKGHDVFLYCLDYTHSLPKFEFYKGLTVCRFRPAKHLYSFSSLAYTIPYYHIRLKKSIQDFLKTNKIEAIHIHDIQIAKVVYTINRRLKLPIVLDLHENRPEIMKFYEHVNSTLGRILIWPKIWKKYEKSFLQKSNKSIVVTDSAKQYYIDHFKIEPNKIHVVPNSVKESFYTNHKIYTDIYDRYKDKFTLLYLGDTGLRRGMMVLIDSISILEKEIPNIKIVVVGTSKADPLLKRKVKDLNLEKYIDLVGWQEVEKFPSFIKASKIGLSPIHKNIHHETTYANKIFQYMSFSKPIIVSDCEAQARLVKKFNCGQVFKDQDKLSLSKKILLLYRDKKLYEEQSKNAYLAIDTKLKWELSSLDLIKLYESI